MRDRLLDLPVAEIVTRIRAGDWRLYEALYTAYWGPLYRVAFAMLRDRSSAEDVVATLFMSVWERRVTWNVQESMQGWFSSAIRNQVRMRWRNTERHDRLLNKYVVPGESPAAGSPEPIDEDDVAEVDRLLALEVAIQALPERQQKVVRYRWYEQRGYDEIATLMGISSGTARNWVSHALTALRAALRES